MKNKAAQELGRKGGQAKSETKTETARANGAKGGRPRLFAWVVEIRNDDGSYRTVTRIPMDRESALREAATQRNWGDKARVARVELGE
jgi:hypothetical protein